jgi:hypothetical protein
MQTAKPESPPVMIPKVDGRGMLLGRTESGKSTLESQLMHNYMAAYSNSRVLLVDSKPRFKAQWRTNGMHAAGLYKNWTRGEYVPGSVVIDLSKRYKSELDAVWRMKSRIAIAQTTPGSLADLAALHEVALTFYGEYSDRIPRLIIVDELADFFEVKKVGGVFWQAARSGRELNIAMIACSQRPSYIPTVVLTEADRIYLFCLDYEEDIKKVYQMGIPKTVEKPTIDHSFFYWNKKERFSGNSGKYYILSLKK